MARNKNRKKSAPADQGPKKNIQISVKKPKPEEAPASKKNRPPAQAPEEMKSSSKKTQNLNEDNDSRPAGDSSPKRPKSLVRLSTCMAGMFLTFILGLYLGSLLPGIMRGMEEEKQLARRALETASAPAPAPPPAPEAKTEQAKAEQNLANTEKGSIRNSIPREILEHIKHLEKDALSHPDDAHIWTELGNAYFDIHEPHNAISAYEHSLRLAHANPDVLTDLGIMYREIKNFDKALECFRKAYQQEPRHINALFNEGVVLSADLGRKAEAARVWARILEIDPSASTPNGQKIADMIHQLQ